MGVQWEIVDKKNRQIYDLDKGGWGYPYPDGPWSEEFLGEFVSRALLERGVKDVGYIAKVVAEVRRFCAHADWNVVLVCDVGDYPDDEMEKWPVVGGRCVLGALP